MILYHSENWDRPVKIEKKDIKKLEKILQTEYKFGEIEAECRDGVERKFRDLSELFKYDNYDTSAITSLKFSIHTITDDKYIGFLSVGNVRPNSLTGVLLAVEESKETLEKLKSILDEEVKTWIPDRYNWAYRTKISVVLHRLSIFSAGLAYLILIMYFVPKSGLWTRWFGSPSAIPDWLGYLGFALLLPLFATSIINVVQDRYFPSASFLIGKGRDKYKRLKGVRAWICRSILAVVVGAIGIFVIDRIVENIFP